MSSRHDSTSYARFLGPRFWPIWILLWWMKFAALLPYPYQIIIGKWLGRIGFHIAAKKRLIAMRNLEICFPELSDVEQKKLLKK